MDAVGGALVIGSLYWDNKDGRDKWRNNNLNMNNGIRVEVPIRYGRFAKERNCYTMVFSKSLSDSQMGCGYVLPHQNVSLDKNDLKMHASKMGKAEGPTVNLVTNWVSVAMLLNPLTLYRKELTRHWKEIIGNSLIDHELLKPFNDEPSPISNDGFLTIPWPKKMVDNTLLANFDYLLATPTLPKHQEKIKNVYPTPQEIARLVNWKGDEDYFNANRKAGITTFQDEEILKFRME